MIKDRALQRDEIIARPKFNGFKRFSHGILRTLMSSDKVHSVEAPLHPIMDNFDTKMLPIGFDMTSNPHKIDDLSRLRFRRDDKLNLILGNEKNRDRTNSDSSSALAEVDCLIEYIYFPLVSVLIPKWLVRNRGKTRRIIYLITGVASPTKQLNTGGQTIDENSTDETGRLLKAFIETHYRDCEVICMHSSTNLFRYDEVSGL